MYGKYFNLQLATRNILKWNATCTSHLKAMTAANGRQSSADCPSQPFRNSSTSLWHAIRAPDFDDKKRSRRLHSNVLYQ
ncbi:Restless-like transposase [Fusarium oxysporum f. sp. albedinis]|nr:Restless-like transposase [Fusarium oxysporum f. sp. albedinis]